MKYISSFRKAFRGLKPETRLLLRLAVPLLVALYCCAVLFYGASGTVAEYQMALLAAQRLSAGVKAGFGVLCLGFVLLEAL
ncbi:MAG: hypothetical protein LBS96_05200 [Oscillospiraceae bacterium]|nr:hypothetical protein [Oscillospiraceae bacterium]